MRGKVGKENEEIPGKGSGDENSQAEKSLHPRVVYPEWQEWTRGKGGGAEEGEDRQVGGGWEEGWKGRGKMTWILYEIVREMKDIENEE